jgi:membrane protein YdbS with pleckstrin-like domain
MMNEEKKGNLTANSALRLKLIKRVFILGFSVVLLVLPLIGILAIELPKKPEAEYWIFALTAVTVIAAVIGIGIYAVVPVLMEYRSRGEDGDVDGEPEMFP